MHRPGGIRVVLVFLLALTALVAGGPVSADTQISHSGLTGSHRLRDTHAAPGATCVYVGPSHLLGEIKIKPPVVYARNTTGSRDHQKVGWRYRIDYWDVNGYWDVYELGTIHTATAWDDTPAAFTATSLTSGYTAMAGKFRVYVAMLWYRNGVVEGRQTHRVDYYRWKSGTLASTRGPNGSCGGQYP